MIIGKIFKRIKLITSGQRVLSYMTRDINLKTAAAVGTKEKEEHSMVRCLDFDELSWFASNIFVNRHLTEKYLYDINIF